VSIARSVLRQDWVLAVALAFFVGVTVWFGRSIRDFLIPSGPDISVPSLVGQTEDDALHEATRLNLRASVIAHTASDQFPKGLVISQEPGAGTPVREGRQISLVVSTGVQIFAMPDLRYETLREVGLDLSQQKLTLGKTKTVPNDDVPAGGVVAQDPPPGASVRVGTVVNLELSAGPPANIKAPSFVNLDIDDARDLATRSRVRIGQVVWTPLGFYGPARGVVVRQRPAPGTELSPDERVSLQVSAGPREAGYLVRQVHARASVPSTGDVSQVRLEVQDDTGTWNLFNGFAHACEKFDFDVTVIGTAELYMYVNNELVSSNKLGVEPPQEEDQSQRPRPAATPKPKP